MSEVADGLDACWKLLAVEAGWNVEIANEVGSELLAAWSEPHRRYHNLRHLEHCLSLFDEHRDRFDDRLSVAFALWHHDCVYDPRAADNEECSADLAVINAERLGLGQQLRQRIHSAILATRHGIERELNHDEGLIVDIDLAILGADAKAFERFEHDVRAEYAFVPWERYRAGRRRILVHLASGDGPFHHVDFRKAFGQRAQQNLGWAIERLDREGDPLLDSDA